jgi:hypothetical protein
MNCSRTKNLFYVLALALSGCQSGSNNTPAGAAPNGERTSSQNWTSCVDDAAKSIVEARAQKDGVSSLYGYHTAIDSEVSLACGKAVAALSNGDHTYIYGIVEKQVKAQIRGQIAKELEEQRKQTERDAPRLAAEKAEEDGAVHNYWECLVKHGRIMALNSSESAEIVARASFPSCAEARQAALDAYRGHTNKFSPEAMNATEGLFYNQLLLEIIKARAAPAAPQAPAPSKQITPL